MNTHIIFKPYNIPKSYLTIINTTGRSLATRKKKKILYEPQTLGYNAKIKYIIYIYQSANTNPK